MNRHYSDSIKKYIFIFFISLFLHRISAEGFLAGTLVKTTNGYKPIETVGFEDGIIADNLQGKQESKKLYGRSNDLISNYIKLSYGNETLCVAPDQKFYVESQWIEARDLLRYKDQLQTLMPDVTIEEINEQTTVYNLTVLDHHNYFVTKRDILVHNVAPAIAIAVTFTFGNGAIEFAGFSAAFGFLGALFGFNAFKDRDNYRVEPKMEIRATSDYLPTTSNGGGGGAPNPEDPDKDKKEKQWEKEFCIKKDMPKGGKIIKGRKYTEHALERMAPKTTEVIEELEKRALEKGLDKGSDKFKEFVNPRNINPEKIENAINTGVRLPNNRPNTWKIKGNGIEVIINEAGDVITTYYK